MKVEEEYYDVLQNIEFAIIGEYRKDGNLMDADVLKTVNVLMLHYRAEKRQHRPTTLHLALKVRRLFLAVQGVCEWRLGRGSATVQQTWDGQSPDLAEPVTAPEILKCLKRIQKSIRLWTKEAGPQGYLEFVGRFVP